MTEFKRLNKILEQIDQAKGLGINQKQVKEIAKKQAEQTFMDGVKEVFDKLDTYQNGYIDIKELKRHFGVE